jgi:hypothetical protein
MFPKFIIQDGDLILGWVDSHFLLKHKDIDDSTIVGGGWFHMNQDEGTLLLYGKSIEYGSVTAEAVKEAFKSPSIEACEILFSERNDFEEAKVNNVKIQEDEENN